MESNKEAQITTVSEENIYKLNGRVPLRKAIPFGLQHVLAMFRIESGSGTDRV